MAFLNRNKSLPENNAIRAWYGKLKEQLRAVSDKLKIPYNVNDLPEMDEVLTKLSRYREPDFAETFVTVKKETFLPNSRKLTAGDNITITDEGPLKNIVIAATGGASEQQWPIIDRLDWVREYEDFVSGGGYVTPNSVVLGNGLERPFDSRSRLNFPNLMFTEDFKAGSSSLPDPVNADLFHAIGARNGVIERLAASNASFTYPPGGGVQLSGGTVSDDVIEYQSAQDAGVSIPDDYFDIFFQTNIPIANNATYSQPGGFPDIHAITGKFIVRIGLTSDAILSGNPPTDGIYLEKTSGNAETNAKWWAVVRAAGVETRGAEFVNYVANGSAQARIRFYFQSTDPIIGFNVKGPGAPYNAVEYFLSSANVPAGPFNLFLQIIPKDAALDTRVTLLKYDVDMSPAVSGAPIPGWSVASVGKTGWAAGFVDTRLSYYTQSGYVTYGRGTYPGLTSFKSHPGIVQIVGGFDPNQINATDPELFLSAFPFNMVSTLFTPWNSDTGVNLGSQFEPWDGAWLQRLIVHIGATDFDAEFVPASLLGLAVEQSIPFPPLVDGGLALGGLIGFYHFDPNVDPNWHFYFDMGSGAPVDVDTGIPVWDALDTPNSPWFIFDFEKKSADSDVWTATLRDETGNALFTMDVTPDTGIWDDYAMGPFGAIENSSGGQDTALGLLMDAHGYKHDLVGRGTEVAA